MSSSFFFKQQQQQNLIYDNTAFIHFMIAICSAIVLVLICMIAYDIIKIVRDSNRFRKIQNNTVFKNKAKIHKQYKKYEKKQTNIVLKIIILCIFVAVGYFCMAQIGDNQQLSGFDPYQILNIDISATQSQIKKAYRKLALETHPDRHVDRIRDPELNRRFIMISKAYKCLTDQATRQNCQKYGNPDGQTSYKIGIGLPQFMLNGQNQYYLIFPLLFTLIVAVPCIFIQWSNHTKNKDKSGIYYANYQILDAAMSTKLNIVDCCVVIGCMKQLDKMFSHKQILKKEEELQFKNFLLQSSNIQDSIINKLNSQQIFRTKMAYQYIHGENNQTRIAYCIPNLCQKIIKFSLFYAKKSLDGSILSKNPKLIVRWLGITPTKKTINFCRAMINRQQITKHTQIKLCQKKQQSQEILSHKQDQKKQQDINQQSILFLNKQEYDLLPKLKLSVEMKLQQMPAKKITTNDICSIDVHIQKIQNTPGLIVSKNFPFLAKQKYILIISHDFNLLSSQIFQFSQSINSVHHNFKLNKPPVGNLKINIRVLSLCYPGLNLYKKLNLQVSKIKERKIQIHQQDKNIQKIPKNFFQYLITMSAENQSDIQLSDDSDTQQIKKPKKSKKAKISRMGQKRNRQNKQNKENIDVDEGSMQKAVQQINDVNKQCQI